MILYYIVPRETIPAKNPRLLSCIHYNTVVIDRGARYQWRSTNACRQKRRRLINNQRLHPHCQGTFSHDTSLKVTILEFKRNFFTTLLFRLNWVDVYLNGTHIFSKTMLPKSNVLNVFESFWFF